MYIYFENVGEVSSYFLFGRYWPAAVCCTITIHLVDLEVTVMLKTLVKVFISL